MGSMLQLDLLGVEWPLCIETIAKEVIVSIEHEKGEDIKKIMRDGRSYTYLYHKVRSRVWKISWIEVDTRIRLTLRILWLIKNISSKTIVVLTENERLLWLCQKLLNEAWLDESYITKFIKHNGKPSNSELRKLCQHLEIEIDKIKYPERYVSEAEEND